MPLVKRYITIRSKLINLGSKWPHRRHSTKNITLANDFMELRIGILVISL